MRQRLSEKNVKKIAVKLGLPLVAATARGGTDHRLNLHLADGSVLYYWPKTGETERSTIGWKSTS